MSRGFFITFEGLDGSGKTTQLRRLDTRLRAEGHPVTSLRQPGSTALGDRLRTVLLDSGSESAFGPIAPMAELALMFADRAQAIAEVIEPALARGEVVLCDRFTDSSEAYQGGGRELGSDCVLALHKAVCGSLQPDLTLLLLPPLEVSLGRARRRNQRWTQRQDAATHTDENRFESESNAFHARIHEAYLAIAVREPERIVLLAGDDGVEEIEKNIHTIVTRRLRDRTAPAASAMLEP